METKVLVKSENGKKYVIISGAKCYESSSPCCNLIYSDFPITGKGANFVELIGNSRGGQLIYRPICTRDKNNNLISDFRAYNAE